jgi:hypothetical protein
MCSPAFLPSLSRIHSYACIYQKIFQLKGLYQVRVPVETNYKITKEEKWIINATAKTKKI